MKTEPITREDFESLTPVEVEIDKVSIIMRRGTPVIVFELLDPETGTRWLHVSHNGELGELLGGES